MKKIVFAMAIMVLSFSLTGQESPYAGIDHQHHDSLDNPFDTDTIHLQYLLDDPMELVKITFTDSIQYRLNIIYRGLKWRFMEGNITIKADDQLFHYQSKKPSRDVVRGGVREILSIPIPAETIKIMAQAKELRIQYYIDPITLDPLNIAAINNFYSHLIATQENY
ncbi:MAG: hypothetical protein PHO89_09625 [Methylacidiphilaceae bacterium]|nr:hypothetical protein [Candidatus Methylacidiphilaceae bacterium]